MSTRRLVSVSWYYKNPTKHDGLVQSRPHLIESYGNLFSPWYTVKPANAVTSIKQSPVLKGHNFLVLSEYFIWIEPLLRGHLSYKTTFSASQRWPLNIGLTSWKIAELVFNNHSLSYSWISCTYFIVTHSLKRECVVNKKIIVGIIWWTQFKIFNRSVKKLLNR